MNELNKIVKSKKYLLFIAMAGIVLLTIVFLFLNLFFIKKEEAPIITPVTPIISEIKTMEGLKKEFSTPVNPDITSVPVSDEFKKSLSSPVNVNNDAVIDSEKNKTDQVAPQSASESVSKDFINKLSAPK